MAITVNAAQREPLMDPAIIPFLKDLWGLIQAAGAVICVFTIYLWRVERAERLACAEAKAKMVEEHRQEKEAITERAVTAINSITVVVQGLKEIIQSGRRPRD